MGWPRKADLGLYAEKKKDPAYFIVIFCNGLFNGCYECIANVHFGSSPSLCGTSCSLGYLHNKSRRVDWESLPEVWKRAFTEYMTRGGDTFDPAKERGFHKVGKCPTK